MNLATIGILIAAIIMIVSAGMSLDIIPKFKKRLPPAERRNLKQEQKLMKMLLKDMKKNAGNWTQNGLSPLTMETYTFINDRKNMAVRYSANMGRVTICLNVKDISNLHKLDVVESDAILTHIEGKHVEKFINTVIALLDHRGKELDYMTNQLGENL